MRRASRRNCATASMSGGACPPRESEAAAARRWRGRAGWEERGRAADSPPAGCAAALAHANPSDRILVFGSFHTVGPALDWLEAHDFLPRTEIPEYTAAPRATYV